MPNAVDHQEALRLLLTLLTPEERASLDKVTTNQGAPQIQVVGSKGGQFIIYLAGSQGNIREVDEHGCSLGTVCVAPADRVPSDYGAMYSPLTEADHWLGQYLAIKYQEQWLRDSGIWSRSVGCLRVARPAGAPGVRLCSCGCGLPLDDPAYAYVPPPAPARMDFAIFD